MIDPKRFLEELQGSGVDFFCGVPDSLLKSFCACLTDSCSGNHVITANEGGAVALASGHYLATGRPALVYMQNSGQGNAVNPLASLADPDVYSIPMLLLVGWRGEPGVHDEPQHVKQGKITVGLFETLGVPTFVLLDEPDGNQVEGQRSKVEQWKDQVSSAVKLAIREKRPVALIVRKGLFAPYALAHRRPDIAALPREQAIEQLLASLPPDAVVVSTTGMISRELYETRERRGEGHSRDFLTVGSMGHASQIALGIAQAQPARPVYCLDGDGASIMQMGNMAIVGQSGCANLTHIVLNNAAHDSVGGQPTVGGAIDLPAIARACGYEVVGQRSEEEGQRSEVKGQTMEDILRSLTSNLQPQTSSLTSNLKPLTSNLQPSTCPKFLEIRVSKGARPDLGRPKEPPQVNKSLFMKTLGVTA